MKLVKLSIVALSMGLFVASCNNETKPAATATDSAAIAMPVTAPPADSAAMKLAADSAAMKAAADTMKKDAKMEGKMEAKKDAKMEAKKEAKMEAKKK